MNGKPLGFLRATYEASAELQDLRDGCEEALRVKDEEIATLRLRINAAERAANAAIETARAYEAAWRRVEREVGKLLKSKELSS